MNICRPTSDLLALCVLASALSGCSGSAGSPVAPVRAGFSASPTPAPSATIAPSPGPSATPLATPTPTPRPTASPAPTSTPTPAPSSTAAEIYVANSGDNSVTVYPANPSGTLNESPLATIAGTNTGLSEPFGIAVDASGKIYVANRTGGGVNGGGSITVYAAHPSGSLNETPLATITGSLTGLSGPSDIAVDANGKIYVTNLFNSITIFAASPSGTVNEAPLATITGSSTALAEPYGVAVDAGGTIYVANEIGGSSDSGTITTYAANPSGTTNEAPLATITGTNTALNDPLGVALGPLGKINVVNFGGAAGSSVTVYASAPSGSLNEAPLATISGSNTALGTSDGIAVDASGKIYVTNTYDNSGAGAITVYAANPSGSLNEVPVGTITGDVTGLHNPFGIAIH